MAHNWSLTACTIARMPRTGQSRINTGKESVTSDNVLDAGAEGIPAKDIIAIAASWRR
jgi:hypothetical protein